MKKFSEQVWVAELKDLGIGGSAGNTRKVGYFSTEDLATEAAHSVCGEGEEVRVSKKHVVVILFETLEEFKGQSELDLVCEAQKKLSDKEFEALKKAILKGNKKNGKKNRQRQL